MSERCYLVDVVAVAVERFLQVKSSVCDSPYFDKAVFGTGGDCVGGDLAEGVDGVVVCVVYDDVCVPSAGLCVEGVDFDSSV